MRWNTFKRILIDCLSDDLLSSKYRKLKAENPNVHPTFGHCYVASEATYYLIGGRETGDWSPQHTNINGCSHWFLKHQSSGFIFDPTVEQFGTIDYSGSRGIGFLTKLPSKRARELIRRIESRLK
jgi:hypothetical protein